MRANIPVWLFNTLCVIAIIALFVCVVAGCTAITNSLQAKDGYNKVHLSFDLGCIDSEDGQVLNANNKLYTENLIECTGFRLTRDYSVNATYEIHFYGEKDTYIASAKVSSNDLEYIMETLPAGAIGIRLVVIPNETNVDLKSWGFFNLDRIQYAGMLDLEATNQKTSTSTGSDGATELAA